jgi:hypothetical protein
MKIAREKDAFSIPVVINKRSVYHHKNSTQTQQNAQYHKYDTQYSVERLVDRPLKILENHNCACNC